MADVVSYPIELPDVPRVWRTDPFDWTLALAAGVDSAGELVDPVDLTGFGTTWSCIARPSGGSDATPVVVPVDSAHAADGYLVLTLSAVQTTALLLGLYTFTVRASGGARSPFTVWRGQLRVAGEPA